jgi:hypothetical protein
MPTSQTKTIVGDMVNSSPHSRADGRASLLEAIQSEPRENDDDEAEPIEGAPHRPARARARARIHMRRLFT